MTKINYSKNQICPFGKSTLVGSTFCEATKHGCGHCYSHDDRKHIIMCTNPNVPKPKVILGE